MSIATRPGDGPHYATITASRHTATLTASEHTSELWAVKGTAATTPVFPATTKMDEKFDRVLIELRRPR